MIHPLYGRPAINGVMKVSLKDDYTKGIIKDNLDKIQIIGRSGHSRAGLQTELNGDSSSEIGRYSNTIEMPVTLSSLRGTANDRLLTILKQTVEETANEHPFEVGRLFISSDDMALTREDIETAKKSGQLFISKHADITDEGVIEVPLEDINYLFCEANFNRYRTNIRDILLHGKHSFEGIQEKVSGLPAEIKPGEFFVGGIKIAIGRYMAVIEKETNDPHVFHLAARILDGLRTTGVDESRQVELYNRGDAPVFTNGLKVRMRLYPIPSAYQKPFAGNPKRAQVKDGIEFGDIAGLKDNPERILEILNKVSAVHSKEGNYALVLAGGRIAKVKWQDLPSFQDRNLEEVTKRLVAGQSADSLTGDAIDENIMWLTDRLFDVGGKQNEGKVVISNYFPEPEVLEKLMKTDVAVFIARDLHLPESAFPLLAGKGRDTQNLNGNKDRANGDKLDVFFTSTMYEQYCAMEKRGAKFFMAYPQVRDPEVAGGVVPAHIRQFYRGFWVKPEAIEQMKKIDTVIAIYGTHIEGLDDFLTAKLGHFFERLKVNFGEKVALTHGKGPGVMRIADNIAREKEIFRIGVGIDLEQQDQAGNYTPSAMVDFQSDDRLRRQKVMDDSATIKIFNIGGGGTLEEAAISLCSQKLCKSIITPIIFIDPIGDSDGDHMWSQLEEQIRTLSTPYYIDRHGEEIHFSSVAPVPAEKKDMPGKKEEEAKPVHLLKKYVPNYCHFVRSYEKAASIIESFIKDPMKYYLEQKIDCGAVLDSINNARINFERTGFPMPSWFNADEIERRCKNPELDLPDK